MVWGRIVADFKRRIEGGASAEWVTWTLAAEKETPSWDEARSLILDIEGAVDVDHLSVEGRSFLLDYDPEIMFDGLASDPSGYDLWGKILAGGSSYGERPIARLRLRVRPGRITVESVRYPYIW